MIHPRSINLFYKATENRMSDLSKYYTGETLLLDCGSGGRAAQRLVRELFISRLGNPVLNKLDDAACLEIHGPIAMSTDSYTVEPLIFPGGDIGALAVHGTVNDVAMLGARPKYISASFILEEGLDLGLLAHIVESMGKALSMANVLMVTGDTKVVPRGAADKIFITTTGVGEILVPNPPSGCRATEGDVILISGHLGNHGLAVMGSRAGLPLPHDVKSDSTCLNHLAQNLVLNLPNVHTLRDPTRGGLATTLNEIAQQSGTVFHIEEAALPILDSVSQGCSILGLDPLYLANEGKLICIVPEGNTEKALEILRAFPEGQDAARIGHVSGAHGAEKPGQVILNTRLGGKRLLPMLEGEQLPRIC